MHHKKELAENIENLRQKIHILILNSGQTPTQEVMKLNQELDRLIVEYTKLTNKNVSDD